MDASVKAVPDAIAPPAAVARTLGWLYLAGAIMVGANLTLLPTTPGADEPGLALAAAALGTVGLALVVAAGRRPDAALAPGLAAGTVLLSVGILLSGEIGPHYALFYVWVALLAGAFERRSAAALQVAAIAAGYGAVLWLGDVSFAVEKWVIALVCSVGAACAAGWVKLQVDALLHRLRHLVAQLERLSRTDPLTGLHNRRGLRELAESAVPRRRPFAVLVADLDHFKRVNDAFGHAAGDEVLVTFARVFAETVRQGDVVARRGGVEFAAVLPDCGGEAAADFGERLREAVREEFAGGVAGVTVSVGVAAYPTDGADLEAVMLAADRALYTAKSAGRDCTVLARTPVLAV